MSIVSEYQDEIANRPNAFKDDRAKPIDWVDAPHRYAVREGAAEIPLPQIGQASPGGTKGAGLSHGGRVIELADISEWLRLSLGVLREKLEIDWNRSAQELIRGAPLLARGTASGGGLYPTELFLVVSGHAELRDGIYQYAESRSSLWLIREGQYSSVVSRALGEAQSRGIYFILSCRIWKNAFKYKSLSYQLVTEDVGAVAATITRLVEEAGAFVRTRYCFVDDDINALLGADSRSEFSLLVMEVGDSIKRPERGATPAAGWPPVPSYAERSRAVDIPLAMSEIHRETLWNAAALASERFPLRPMAIKPAVEIAIGRGTAPPPLTPLNSATLLKRRSSMGLQNPCPPFERDELASIITAIIRPYHSDIDAGPGAPSSIRLGVYANAVDGVPRGAHFVVAGREGITLVEAASRTDNIQEAYVLDNYNLDNAAAILVVFGRTRAMREIWGERSIRIANAEAGMAAQRAYIRAAEMDLACGAVFGIRPNVLESIFYGDEADDKALVAMFLSRPPGNIARLIFDYV